MAEEMVRASGGFSRVDMAKEKAKGKAEGIAETKVGTAQPSDVLSEKTFTNSSAVGASGSMPNRGKTDIIIPSRLNTSQRIPAGYHNGNGVLSVAAPSGTRNLAANEVGTVDLYPYDYRSVNASAVYSAGQNEGYPRGYNAGLSYANSNFTRNLEEFEEGHIAAKTLITNVIVGNGGHFDKICFAVLTLARPKGNGYADPEIYVYGTATDLGTTGKDYSDGTASTNISTTYRGARIAPGQEATFELQNEASVGAAYTYFVMSYYIAG